MPYGTRTAARSARNIKSNAFPRKSSHVPMDLLQKKQLTFAKIADIPLFERRSLPIRISADREVVVALLFSWVVEVSEAEEVGSKIADAIVEYFASEENLQIIERLRSAGLQFEVKDKIRESNALEGKSVVISGKFAGMSRDDMKALVEEHGGRNLAAVSANVDFIVAGENMGPAKRQKAEKLGVTILSEEEFMAMIEGAPIVKTTPAEPQPQPTKEEAKPIQGTLF